MNIPLGNLKKRRDASASARDAHERVTLVNREDEVIGSGAKLEVHRTGQLHRAFSVILKDQSGRLLLQRRSSVKYHFPNLWSNACCGHPRPGEATQQAAKRRLSEELGIAADLSEVRHMTYRAADPITGMVEHEYLHVLQGTLEAPHPLYPDPLEVGDWRWMDTGVVRRAMRIHPCLFTPWFRLLFKRLDLGR